MAKEMHLGGSGAIMVLASSFLERKLEKNSSAIMHLTNLGADPMIRA